MSPCTKGNRVSITTIQAISKHLSSFYSFVRRNKKRRIQSTTELHQVRLHVFRQYYLKSIELKVETQ